MSAIAIGLASTTGSQRRERSTLRVSSPWYGYGPVAQSIKLHDGCGSVLAIDLLLRARKDRCKVDCTFTKC